MIEKRWSTEVKEIYLDEDFKNGAYNPDVKYTDQLIDFWQYEANAFVNDVSVVQCELDIKYGINICIPHNYTHTNNDMNLFLNSISI